MKLNKFFGALMAVAALAIAFASCDPKDTDVIKLKVSEASVSVAATYQIEVVQASGTITWASSDAAIASVDQEGKVYGVAEGQATITATVGKASAAVAITVTPGGVTPQPTDAPTPEILANNYDIENSIVLCVFFESEICQDVVIAGSYNGWATADPAEMIHMEALEGFEGWYVAEIPFDAEAEAEKEGSNQAKPVQLQDGGFLWDFQTGDPDSWEYVAGKEATIVNGYDGEANVSYPEAGAYIYVSKYFKNHKSPCVAAVYHDYVVILKAPECGGFEPGIIGDFNGWSASQAMDLQADGTYKYAFNDCEGHAFKFRALDDTDWSNQIQLLNDSNQYYDNPNITLTDVLEISLDYSEGIYTLCEDDEEPTDTTTVAPVAKF